MTEVEYVYKKPLGTKKSHKKLIGISFLIVIIVLSSYFLYININNVYDQTFTVGNQTYIIPSNYKGLEGLNYIKQNYASGLEQARGLCINTFKGNWVDTSNSIGCYDMQGFSIYCNMDAIKNLTNLCNSIRGIPTCDSTQASCKI